MYKDRYGLAVTTDSSAAAQKYFQAMDSHLAGNAFSEKWYHDATLLDPQFALANIAHAANLYAQGKKIEGQLYRQKAMESLPYITLREKQHIHIMNLLIDGRSTEGLQAIIAHVKVFPLDALLVSAAVGGFGLFSFNGECENNQQRLHFMESLKSTYGLDWWFLSLYAFSLVEVFDIKQARLFSEQSLKLNWRNGHAAHSFTHVCYESGLTQECIDFTSNWVVGYERDAHLYGHIHWHWALSELALGDFEKTKKIYDEHLQPSVSLGDAMGTLADAISLQWRAMLNGKSLLTDSGINDLTKYAETNRNLNGVLFGEAHLGVLYAHQNIDQNYQQMLQEFEMRNTANPHAKFSMMTNLLKGIKAYAEQDYNLSISLLKNNLPEFARLGGSNAQREFINDTLIQAYLKVGNQEAIQQIVDQKLHRMHAL